MEFKFQMSGPKLNLAVDYALAVDGSRVKLRLVLPEGGTSVVETVASLPVSAHPLPKPAEATPSSFAPVPLLQNPPPAAPRAVKTVKIPDGTPVRLSLAKALSPSRSKANEEVRFHVAEDVKVDGIVVIGQGWPAKGHVLEGTKGFGIGQQLVMAALGVGAGMIAIPEGAEVPACVDGEHEVKVAYTPS